MKRFLFMMAAVLLLAACGGNEEPVNEEESVDTNTAEGVEETAADVEVSEPETEEELPATSNALEFADKTNDINIYDEFANNYEIIGRYTHDKENEQGINEIAFDDFLFRFGVLAVEEEETGDQYIVFAGESENNTNKELYFAPEIEIVTSNQEQSEMSNEGAGRIQPGVIENTFSMIPIERGVPDSFEVTIYPPYTDDWEDVGPVIESEFHLE